MEAIKLCFFVSSRRRHTRWPRDWSSDVCSSDLSGRIVPIMDQLAMHPYGDSSSQPPKKSKHPGTTIGLADYAKLVRILGESFDGTGQRGSNLPILYEEFGVESRIPKNKLGR